MKQHEAQATTFATRKILLNVKTACSALRVRRHPCEEEDVHLEENGLWEEKALGVVVRRLEIFEREDLARGRWVRYRLRRRVSKMDEPLVETEEQSEVKVPEKQAQRESRR